MEEEESTRQDYNIKMMFQVSRPITFSTTATPKESFLLDDCLGLLALRDFSVQDPATTFFLTYSSDEHYNYRSIEPPFLDDEHSGCFEIELTEKDEI